MFSTILWINLVFSIFPYTMPGEVPNGICSCSVMRKGDLNAILENNLQINVPCNEEGTDSCQRLCVALAESAREKAPNLICQKLNQTVINLQVELYSKICVETEWKSTGLKSTEPFCCWNGKATICSLMLSSHEEY